METAPRTIFTNVNYYQILSELNKKYNNSDIIRIDLYDNGKIDVKKIIFALNEAGEMIVYEVVYKTIKLPDSFFKNNLFIINHRSRIQSIFINKPNYELSSFSKYDSRLYVMVVFNDDIDDKHNLITAYIRDSTVKKIKLPQQYIYSIDYYLLNKGPLYNCVLYTFEIEIILQILLKLDLLPNNKKLKQP